MTVTWVRTLGEPRVQFTPVGLRVLDDFTGRPPTARFTATLEARTPPSGPGPYSWRRVDSPPTLTPGGWIAFIGLGRTVDPLAKPVVRHRVSVVAEDMLPLYGPAPGATSVEFDVHPFDDTHLPTVPVVRTDIFLLPAPAYAFPSEVPVARGRVVDGANRPVARALVTFQNFERVLSDERGQFALPLRWAAKNTTVQIDAADGLGHVGAVPLAIPGGLRHALEIQIA